jgi:micrococcal nuclease
MKVKLTGEVNDGGSNSGGSNSGGSNGNTDPRFSACYKAIAAGYGPYRRGVDEEYAWYRDSDGDGVVCE